MCIQKINNGSCGSIRNILLLRTFLNIPPYFKVSRLMRRCVEIEMHTNQYAQELNPKRIRDTEA